MLTLLLTPCSYASAVETPAEEEPVVRVGEVESLRETNSETYLMSDGTYECVVYAENKYYLDENEVLQPINNAIVAASSGANLLSTQYTNTANAFDVTFSGSGTPEISISYGEAGITFVPVNATGSGNMHMTASASAIAIGGVENCSTLSQLAATGSNTATYANAFGTADLVYVLENDALKEYIILEDSAAPNSYNFLFTLDGVTLQETDTGAAFLNEAGEAVFYLGGLFAVDANGIPTDALTYTFQPVKNNIIGVTVTLDPEYLGATDRAFPVAIDPTIMISSSSTADACVCSYTPDTNYQMATQLRTGFCTDYGIRRSYIKFDIPTSIPAGSVTSARFDIEKMSGSAPNIRAYRVTGSWSSGTIKYSNQPYYTSTNCSGYLTQLSSGSSWYTTSVTAIVQGWVNGTYPNYGFLLKDQYESDPNKWTTWYSSDANSPHKPELYITYTAYPGCKPYVSTSSTSINCHGYAYFTNNAPEIIDEYIDEIYSKDTNNEALAITQYVIEDWMDAFFRGRWQYGDLYSELGDNQWLIAMRVGLHTVGTGKKYDYHFWYRTNTWCWANKHGKAGASELLPISDLPTTDSSSGWAIPYPDGIFSEFYDSDIIYYIITEK